MKPDISYIIPVYNVAHYIGACLDSILAQRGDYTREIILVDDESTDGSHEIYSKYATHNPCIKVLKVSHGGLSRARNHGIACARGEFITFVDSDDMLAPDYEKTLLDIAHQQHCDAVICSATRGIIPQYTLTAKYLVYSPKTILRHILYQRHGILNSAWGRIFRREAIAGELFMPDRYYEDLEWTPRVLDKIHTDVIYTPSRLYFYRDHRASFLNTPSPRRLDIMYMADSVLHRLENLGDKSLIRAAHERRFSAYFNTLISHSQSDEIAHQCWQVIKQERWRSLTAPHTRLKSRLGALISYSGKRFTILISTKIGVASC